MYILTLKSLHIIFMVSWFAGLFFMGRVLIYQKEAFDNGKQDIFDLTKSAAFRVWYIITLPSMLLTIGFGLSLAWYLGAFREGWLHMKLLLVFSFAFYNLFLNKLRIKLADRSPVPKSWQLRLINEVPFLFLVGIIFTVYMKDFFSGLWALLVVILIAALISMIVYVKRKKS